MKILLAVVGAAAILAALDIVEFYMPMEFEDMSVNRHSFYVHLDLFGLVILQTLYLMLHLRGVNQMQFLMNRKNMFHLMKQFLKIMEKMNWILYMANHLFVYLI